MWFGDPQKIGPKVEKMMAKQLDVSTPIPWEVVGEGQRHNSSTVMGEILNVAFGTNDGARYQLSYELSQPRPTQIITSILKMGFAANVGGLVMSTSLTKRINGKISLIPHSLNKFEGDPAACESLNGDRELFKRIEKFLRRLERMGKYSISTSPTMEILPIENGAMLVARTLPTYSAWSGAPNFHFDRFYNIADSIEASLPRV